MRTVNEEARRAKQIEIMEKCFDCYAEYGLNTVGGKAVADASGCNVASMYQYFDNLDDLIVKSTEYCMSKVEDDFMAKAPTDVENLWRFIDEIPYRTAEKHGKKYRICKKLRGQAGHSLSKADAADIHSDMSLRALRAV